METRDDFTEEKQPLVEDSSKSKKDAVDTVLISAEEKLSGKRKTNRKKGHLNSFTGGSAGSKGLFIELEPPSEGF